MHDLPKSMLSFALATPLLGAEQALRALSPRQFGNLMLETMREASHAVRAFAPGAISGSAEELGNKLRVFTLFTYADQSIGTSRLDRRSLAELVSRVLDLGPDDTAWTMEGLGYYWTENRDPDAFRDNLPEVCLVPLHAGLGLYLAVREIDNLSRFLDLVSKYSAPGYSLVTAEALGVVARTMYPHSLLNIENQLNDIDRSLIAYFWHGVGRGAYFAPFNAVRSLLQPTSALYNTVRDASDDIARRNAVSGFAWALTLVNIQMPAVIESFLCSAGANVPEQEAFARGVSAAIAIWKRCAPEDEAIARIIDYKPAGCKTRWRSLIANPAIQGGEIQETPGELFKCP
jgi:hypothetical protein